MNSFLKIKIKSSKFDNTKNMMIDRIDLCCMPFNELSIYTASSSIRFCTATYLYVWKKKNLCAYKFVLIVLQLLNVFFFLLYIYTKSKALYCTQDSRLFLLVLLDAFFFSRLLWAFFVTSITIQVRIM